MAFFAKKKDQEKQRQAFAEEAMPHLKSLYPLAFRYCANQSDAEDLVQETFVKAYQAYTQFTPGTNMRAWLSRILTNTFINHYRKKQKEKSGLETAELAERSDDLWTANAGPLFGAVDQGKTPWLGEHLRRAFEELPTEYQTVVLLADVEELSYKEISNQLDIPIGTVMSRLYRGRKSMKAMLIQQAKDYGIIEENHEDVEQRGTASAVSLEEYRRKVQRHGRP